MSGFNQEPWPPILPTKRAAEYCSVDRSTLTRAAAAGELAPYGRRGKTLTWRREDLDRWMRGDHLRVDVAKPQAKLETRAASTSSDALARIRELARGAR